ncbi:unnamed protein product [Camellia sinensis]
MGSTNLEAIQIIKKPGGSLKDSFLDKGQMHGIERLSMKLMQELKSMKDILEGNLHSEATYTTLLKYSVDQ